MKPRSQVVTADGFDTNVAEKMPKIRKLEEPLPSPLQEEPQTLEEDHIEPLPEMRTPEEQAERKVIFESPKKGMFAALPSSIALRRRGLPPGSPPPINALRQPVPDMTGWSQAIKVENVLPDNISSTFAQPLGSTDIVRVTVTISYQGPNDAAPEVITQVSWLVPVQ